MELGEKQSLVVFGGNLPLDDQNPAEIILQAAQDFSGEGLEIVTMSRVFSTPCFPVGAGPDYANAAALINVTSSFTAKDVLAALHRIEARYGRERNSRWAGRTLDLDLVAMGQQVIPDAQTYAQWRDLSAEDQRRLAPDQLILPHPRLQDRAFVLVPLADVAPDWVHPVLGKTVLEMLQRQPKADIEAVKPL